MPDEGAEAHARRILRHLRRQASFAHARAAPEHDQRPEAAERAIDDRANRATFGLAPHKSGSFRERERRSFQHHREGLRMIGTRWRRIATRTSLLRWLNGHRRSSSKLPRNREIRIRLVGAEIPG